ncbi:PRC-barrel domain-containing protein [Wenxinia saemankumensis]|uniref:PRC-barrel domain-containing protein n=1 Tax=Wenxinia saemankumensis TaxID=1447782 RepID=A0A1M6EMS3_9RHOB|nr:PRC-barrel domain-containing protein [Wenxinia saemankumensis]SHI86679.1 PRC-barrel domain-containing protein [Wenxinia saemankumensis]
MRTLLASAATAALLATGAIAQDAASGSYDMAESDYFASDLLGSRIYGVEGDLTAESQMADLSEGWEDIGEINDIVMNEDGSIGAVIVGVGGFLGIGEKDVALGWDTVQTFTDEAGERFLAVSATQESLENAPAFEYNPLQNDISQEDGMATTEDGAMADPAMAEGDMATDEAMTDETMTDEATAEGDMATEEAMSDEEMAATEMAEGDMAEEEMTEGDAEMAEVEVVEGDAAEGDMAEEEMAAAETDMEEPAATDTAEADMAEGDMADGDMAEGDMAAADAEGELMLEEEATGTDMAEGDMAAEDPAMAETDMAADGTGMATDPAMAPEGFTMVPVAELTAEELDGAAVISSVDGGRVGDIGELILNDEGQITQAVVDVGGFLGIGEKPVALSFEDLSIMREDGSGRLQIEVSATQEQLEGMESYAD